MPKRFSKGPVVPFGCALASRIYRNIMRGGELVERKITWNKEIL